MPLKITVFDRITLTDYELYTPTQIESINTKMFY